jgi:hypothetical protein
MEPDFSGWATKANLKCSDGRTITPDAFKHMNGQQVPLVWQHGHNNAANVLGHGILTHKPEGMRIDAFFNKTKSGQDARELVEHGDIKALSIYANALVEKNKFVIHGDIKETSLVLAGANKGAVIDNVNIRHADGTIDELDDEAIIFTGLEFFHSEETATPPADAAPPTQTGEPSDATVEEVWNTLTPEQQDVVEYIVGAAVQDATDGDGTDAEHSDKNKQEGTGDMTLTHNVFEQNNGTQTDPNSNKKVLSHEDVKGIFELAKKNNTASLKATFEEYCLAHGITPMDVLFPNYTNLDTTPQFNSRRMAWVQPFLDALSHTPFSRVRSITADITMDQARALGYVKGTLKKDEWFSVSKRVTGPTTVYKRQTLDRDDVLDITDFDVVSWIAAEMQVMLKEELARAILISDGRAVDDPNKIKDPMNSASGDGIRSIINENELYKTDVNVNLTSTPNYALIPDAVLSAMEFYKGSGQPNFYTTLPILTKMLLIRDTLGHRLYPTVADLAAEMQVANIIPVEVMEGVTGTDGALLGVIVNPSDYNVGADKGGEVNLFDFFDIDYNQLKHLIETRISGALTKIKSAMVVWSVPSADVAVTPTVPTFNYSTGVATVPTETGVVYKDGNGNTLTAGAQTAVTAGNSLTIVATPASGYYFPLSGNSTAFWTFTQPETV